MSSCLFPEHHKARAYGGLVALAVVAVLVYVFQRIVTEVAVVLGLTVAALLAARAVYAVARFACLPAAAKRHYPAAVWARFRWRWLTRALGLAYIDQHKKAVKPVPFGTSVKVDKSAGEQAVLRFPRAQIRADEHGLVATVRTVPKVGRQEFEDQAEHIANQWRCQRVSVSQAAPGRLVVRGLRQDPLLVPFGVEAAPEGLSASRLWAGRDEYGNHRFAELPNCPAIVMGGLPGGGKSTQLASFLAQLAPHDCVQMALLDGKGSGEMDDFEPRAWLLGDDDLEGALRILEEVHSLMVARLATVRETLGVKNSWHVGPTVDWPLVVLTLDECQQYLDLPSVKGDRDREALVRRCIALVASLVRRGRSAMFLTLLATQRPTVDATPAQIRDNAPLAMAFGLKTTDAAVATLGSSIRDYPSYSPTTLADPVYAGCFTATLKTGHDPFTRIRAPWITEAQAAAVAAASAHLRKDPQASLPVAVPDDVSELVTESSGSSGS